MVASCLAPVLYWQMELDLAEAQLYICLGFTLGWKLEAASLSVKRQGNSVLNVWAGRMQGFLGQDLFCIICHGRAKLPVQTLQRCFIPWAGRN